MIWTKGYYSESTIWSQKNIKQYFSLGFEPSKRVYLKVVERKYEKRMSWIERCDPNYEKKNDISPIRNTFSHPTRVI